MGGLRRPGHAGIWLALSSNSTTQQRCVLYDSRDKRQFLDGNYKFALSTCASRPIIKGWLTEVLWVFQAGLRG
jgi:hypothetical protein